MGLHLLPFIASFLFIWAYRQPDGKTCSFLCAAAGVVYLFYNYFIGATMAFMIGPLGLIYVFSTAFFSPVNASKVGILYIIAVILTFFIGYNDFWDVFALMATIFSTASLFLKQRNYTKVISYYFCIMLGILRLIRRCLRNGYYNSIFCSVYATFNLATVESHV